MKKVTIEKNEYEILKNEKNALDLDEVIEKITDYFYEFDYIFGDYSYDKLRLKGFNDEKNENIREYNNINGLEKYIENYCSYGAKYFLLKKIK